MLLCPDEVSISDIVVRKSLSPRSFATIDVVNKDKVELSSFLVKEKPFVPGVEPGSFSYVNKSTTSFLRNSCIDLANYSNQVGKEIYLNPHYGFDSHIKNEDVLLCKDANIGDACLFIKGDNAQKYAISSGVVKLNFNDDLEKFYCLAFLRDEYFHHQLDAITPKGSTIRHAGKKFLQCKLPRISSCEELLLPIISSLVKNIAYAERCSQLKLEEASARISAELTAADFSYADPCISSVIATRRIDAGFYSEVVARLEHAVKYYKNGAFSLKEFGFQIQRGPNLAKRDLGRSLKSDDYRKNYHLLVYPSDISDNGYLLKEVYIGARNPVWYLKKGDILFSAEGTVGKVFIICDEDMKFTTNFHGIIISPSNKNAPLSRSIILGQYLHYLRTIGYFDKVSVGGQGGSFAVNYWDNFKVPNFPSALETDVALLYHSGASLSPTVFCQNELAKAGVFELNQFRIKCSEVLKKIIRDIKAAETAPPGYYDNYISVN